MIDIGVNLLHAQFDGDRDAVLARAWAAGLEQLVITGTDLGASLAAADYAASHGAGRLTATAGIHPHHAREAPADWLAALRRLATRTAVVAIGETGLDFNRNFSPPADQERVFRQHLSLAADLHMPVFVHDREAGETVAACLQESADLTRGVVVHCFTGTASDLERYLQLRCCIGSTGWVCDRRRGAPLRELVPRIPLERLMIETDAPFLRPHNAPADHHGRRNEPALLRYVVSQLAELYQIEESQVAAVTADNARRFFGLPAAAR